MTGSLTTVGGKYNYTTDNTSYGLNLNNSDLVGVNGLFINDVSDTWSEGICFLRNNGNWDSIYAVDGTFYISLNSGGSIYTVMHSGNSGHTHSYLPLTGGTVTGLLKCNSGLRVSGRTEGTGDDEGIVVSKASNGYAGITLGTPTATHTTIYLDTSDEARWVYKNSAGVSTSVYHPGADGTICVKVKVNGSTYNADKNGLVDLGTISGGGGGTGAYVPLSGGTMTGGLQVNALITAYNYTNSHDAAAIKFDKPSSNWTGIGAHAVADTIFFGACDSNGDWITSYQQKWLFNGDVTANGGVTSLSDKRHKNIIGNTDITVENIASMSSVLFKWSDGRNDDSVHAGSIAQDWEGVLPQVVTKSEDEEGTLSLNYGVAALISSITTARKVVDHEKEIKALKAKINVLEERISELEG